MPEFSDILAVLRLAAAGRKLFEGCADGAAPRDRDAAHRAYMARTDLVRSLVRDDYLDHTHALTARGRAYLENAG